MREFDDRNLSKGILFYITTLYKVISLIHNISLGAVTILPEGFTLEWLKHNISWKLAYPKGNETFNSKFINLENVMFKYNLFYIS